jgi:hypothetical protein
MPNEIGGSGPTREVTMSNTHIAEIPARELIAELVRRLGAAEVCRQLGVPASTDLGQWADKLDGIAS